MPVKKCSACGLDKNENDFHKKLNGKSSQCKACTKISNTIYRNLHKNKLYEYRKNYYQDNKQELINYGKEYRLDPNNKKNISDGKKIYFQKNKRDIYDSHNKRRKIRREEDPSYKLRNLISRSVARMLKNNGSSKKGGSIKNNLLFSIDELKKHLEHQFEPWMNWNNQRKYNPKTWNDSDQTTWTWHLDHIIPQSDLPYTTMTDDNFKKCWSLENLRPLPSKQNVLDGITKIRHKGK